MINATQGVGFWGSPYLSQRVRSSERREKVEEKRENEDGRKAIALTIFP
jgi:hypothetical protein